VRGKLRAIDLYAGIGGWSLGLKMAGVEVVRSFERWPIAVDTYNANLSSRAKPVDLRELDLKTLPKGISVVVGSPPCTEFSFANKGGNGNVAEGVKDVVRFLEIVRHVEPDFWVMENVPRVADVIREGFATRSHPLYKFRDLEPTIEIVNFAEFGLPQSRFRCVVGNIPFDLLNAYKASCPRMTLGDVVSALARKRKIRDPIWGGARVRSKVTELEIEGGLDAEQLRMNKDAKVYHPVYNNMAFPDDLDEPSRTVTATCTRVSRESIIIPDSEHAGHYRRLSVRERASLQGFPITYQLYSKNYTDKVKVVGNAVPPPFAYLIASAIMGIEPIKLKPVSEVGNELKQPTKEAPVTPPNGRGLIFPAKRTFRAAIPSLRFKSGMRFELANAHSSKGPKWCVRFFYGPSKDIQTVKLDARLLARLRRFQIVKNVYPGLIKAMGTIDQVLAGTSPLMLQQVWSHRSTGTGPYQVVDRLGTVAKELRKPFRDDPDGAAACVLKLFGYDDADSQRTKKLRRHAAAILAGLALGAWFNTTEWHLVGKSKRSARRKRRK
jgi:DNA (cytosine-5)-methyltransferase 1